MLLERLVWLAHPQCEVTVVHAHAHRWKDTTCSENCYMCAACQQGYERAWVEYFLNLPERIDSSSSTYISRQNAPFRPDFRGLGKLVFDSLSGGMEHQNHVDWQLFQDIYPISFHEEEEISSFHVYPDACQSSSDDWIGAQQYCPPILESQNGSSFEGTVADTVLHTESSSLATTQIWTQKSLQQKSQPKKKS